MPLSYVKLAHVVADIGDETTTRAVVMAAVAAGMKVVTLKGRILTETEVGGHLDGTLDGEAVLPFAGTDAER